MPRQTSKRALRRKRNRQKVAIWPFIVGGILLLTALFLLPSKQEETAPPREYSTIPAEVNYPAPELTLKNINGEAQSLTDFRDKVVLVNNWRAGARCASATAA